MLFDDHAEHRLAFKISASILAILIAVACVISLVFYVLKTEGDRGELTNWLSIILGDPGRNHVLRDGNIEEINAFYSGASHIPPPLRNIIIRFTNGSVWVYGPLSSFEVDGHLFEHIEASENTFEVEISNRRFVFLGKRLPDRTIFVYASLDGEIGHFSKEILSLVAACLLFTFGLYFVARRIARQSFAPMHESFSMMGLYNRNIAHELRTPLAVLRSDLELASWENTSPHIRSALEEADAIEKIIDGLLFLAENRSTGKRSQLSPRDILEKKWENLERNHADRNLRLELHSTRGLTGDPELVPILLSILLDNAYVHGKEGTSIRVLDTKNGLAIENELEDAIPESVMAHIFEPFIKFKSFGSWLGLSMARKIVEMQGWTLTFTQKDGRFSAILTLSK